MKKAIALAVLFMFFIGPARVMAESAVIGVNYWPQDGSKVMQYLNDWPNSKAVADKDLTVIKQMGFKVVRILYQIQHYGDAYMAWGSGARIAFYQNQGNNIYEYSSSTPFAPPTASQIDNLKQYLDLIRSKGLDFEFVLPMQASGQGGFYTHGETDDHYKRYLDVIFPVVKAYKPRRFYIMGDGVPAQNEDHGRWLKNMWPYIVDNCPMSECNLAIEVGGVGANLWGPTIDNIKWIKANLNPWPSYLGVEYYPSTKAPFLCQAGYTNATNCQSLKRLDKVKIDWARLTNDYWDMINKAVGGGFLIQIEEMGLRVGTSNEKNSDGTVGFNEQDQVEFFETAISIFRNKTQSINIWLFEDLADSAGGDDFGLRRTDKSLKPAGLMMPKFISNNNNIISLIDFEKWREESFGQMTTVETDWSGDGKVDLADFEIWKAIMIYNFMKN